MARVRKTHMRWRHKSLQWKTFCGILAERGYANVPLTTNDMTEVDCLNCIAVDIANNARWLMKEQVRVYPRSQYNG